MLKKIASIALAAALTFSLSGCLNSDASEYEEQFDEILTTLEGFEERLSQSERSEWSALVRESFYGVDPKGIRSFYFKVYSILADAGIKGAMQDLGVAAQVGPFQSETWTGSRSDDLYEVVDASADWFDAQFSYWFAMVNDFRDWFLYEETDYSALHDTWLKSTVGNDGASLRDRGREMCRTLRANAPEGGDFLDRIDAPRGLCKRWSN